MLIKHKIYFNITLAIVIVLSQTIRKKPWVLNKERGIGIKKDRVVKYFIVKHLYVHDRLLLYTSFHI